MPTRPPRKQGPIDDHNGEGLVRAGDEPLHTLPGLGQSPTRADDMALRDA